jgi:hypothetical protein
MKIERARILIEAASLTPPASMFDGTQALILACLQSIIIMTRPTDSPLSPVKLLRVRLPTLPAFIRGSGMYVVRAEWLLLENQPVLAYPVANIRR